MFMWLADKVPFFVTPKGRLVPLDVENDIPYLHVDGLHSKGFPQTHIAKMCGVQVSRGTLTLTMPGLTQACPAVDGDAPLTVHDGIDSDGVDDLDLEESGDSAVSDSDGVYDDEGLESDDGLQNVRLIGRQSRSARSSAHNLLTHKPCSKENCEVCARAKKKTSHHTERSTNASVNPNEKSLLIMETSFLAITRS